MFHSVIIRGFPSISRAEAASRIAQVFRLAEPDARAFIAELPVVAKRGLSVDDAREYRDLLLAIGAEIEVDPPLPVEAPPDEVIPPAPGLGLALAPTPFGRDAVEPSAYWGGSDKPKPAARVAAPQPAPAGAPIYGSPAPADSDPAADFELQHSAGSAASGAYGERDLAGAAAAAPNAPLELAPQSPSRTPSPSGSNVTCQRCGQVQSDASLRCMQCMAPLRERPSPRPASAAQSSSARFGTAQYAGNQAPKGTSIMQRAVQITIVVLVTLVVATVVVFIAKSGGTPSEKLVLAETPNAAIHETGRASLAGGEVEVVSIALGGHQCMTFGAVSNAQRCDIDIAVTVNGIMWARDFALNNEPVVIYCSPAAVSVQAVIANATSDACRANWAFGTSPAVGATPQAMMVDLHARRLLANPAHASDLSVRSLDNGESFNARFTPPAAGCYALVAVGPGQSDLDAVVATDAGNIGMDVLIDSFPVIEFCVADQSVVTAELSMFAGEGEFAMQWFQISESLGRKLGASER